MVQLCRPVCVHDTGLDNLLQRARDPSIRTSVIHTLWMLREYEAVLARKVEAPLVVASTFVALGRENEVVDCLASREPRLPPTLQQMIGVLRALLEGRWVDAVAAIRAIASSGFRDPEPSTTSRASRLASGPPRMPLRCSTAQRRRVSGDIRCSCPTSGWIPYGAGPGLPASSCEA